MLVDIKLEKLSGHESKGKVGEIFKKVGDKIKKDEELLEVESKKGNVTVHSEYDGEIKEILIEQGDEVSIGEILLKAECEAKETKKTQNEKKKEKKSEGISLFNLNIKQKEQINTDITVIGAGPGGYVAAIQAVKLGKKVVLIEKEFLGGTCLNWGCIPTKALVRSAELYKQMKESEKYGISSENITANIEKIMERKNSIVKELRNGVSHLINKNEIKLVKGEGKIIDKNKVVVDTSKKETTINTENIIIATGSKPSILNIEGVQSENVLTSKEILDIDEIPNELVIIGGGVIGMEFAFIFNSLGSKVTVIEYSSSILSVLDDDVCTEITNIAKEEGIKIYTNSGANKILQTEGDKKLVCFTRYGEQCFVTGDKVLMSTGRQPYFDGVGVEELEIELNERGRGIKVNNNMRTNIDNIYAIGDVTNKIQLAHVASHQGIVAVKDIINGDKEMNYSVVPSAIFTDPEIAVVGLSEKDAEDRGVDIEIGKFPFCANGKALTLGERKGFVKVIREKNTDKIVGGAIIGPHATDLIHEIALAIKNELTSEDISETIHAHPTTAETIHEATLATTKEGALHFVEDRCE